MAPRGDSIRDLKRAYPIRVRVTLPRREDKPDYWTVHDWCAENLPRGDAWQGPVESTTGLFYFRSLASAAAFFERFPMFTLADSVSAMGRDRVHEQAPPGPGNHWPRPPGR